MTGQQLRTDPEVPLICDEALGRLVGQYLSIADAGEAVEPPYWSDVTDTNLCEGTKEVSILTGWDPLLDGY